MSASRKQIASSSDEATGGFSLLSAITKCLKAAGLAMVVWCWGYMELSIGWLFMALFFHMVNEEFRTFKESKKAFAQHSLVSEKEAILSKLDDYPSWVYFPEAEKARWFNKIMTQMWPYIGEYVEDLMRTTIQQSIRGSLPNKFQNFSFGTIDLGDVSPNIDNIVTYHDVIVKDEIVCDVEFRYNGDAVIKMNMAGGVSAGIKHISVSGKMRVIMKPLVAQAPFIGAVTVFFLNRPKVNFDLTEVANLGDIFGFSKLLRGSVEQQIAQYLVVPNRLPVALVPGIDVSKLKHPMPKGVIHLLIIEARNLKGADNPVIGNSRSDPYCIIQVGSKEFRSKTVNKSTSPVWNEHFELIIDESFGQFISIDVTDEDRMDRDDSLGIVYMSVEAIVKQKSVNVWQQLENVTTGSIHVSATWYRLCADIEEMKKRREVASKTKKSLEETLSTGVLLFVLESADEISRSDKPDSLRNVFARVTVGRDTQESSVQYKTNKPRWDESFQFLIDDPETRPITIELWHKGSTKDKKLGAATVPVSVVLTMDNMTTVKQIAMSDVSPSCTLTVHLSLRIMMRHITKACFSSPTTTSDDLLPPNINNNNADAAATRELVSPELTTPKVTTPELTSHSARV